MRRNDFKDRCEACFQRTEFCLCAAIPRFDLAVRVVFLIHRREVLSTTNTGRIAAKALTNSEIRWRGVPGIEYDVSDFDPTETLLLFPSSTAVEIGKSAANNPPKPKILIVPDGSWTQATRCVRRDPDLMRLTKVKFALEVKNPYRIRKSSSVEQLSTLEAVALSLGVWEGPEVESALSRLYHLMAKRTLISRGRIKRLGQAPDLRDQVPFSAERLGRGQL